MQSKPPIRFAATAALLAQAGCLAYCGTLRSDYTAGFIGAGIALVLAVLIAAVRKPFILRSVQAWVLVSLLAVAGWILGKGARFAFRDDLVYGLVTKLLVAGAVLSAAAGLVLRHRSLSLWFASEAERELLESRRGD